MGTTINIFWAPLVLCFDVHLMHGNNSEKHLEDFQWGSQTRKESYSISPNLWVSLQLIHCRDCSSLGNHFKCYNIYHFLTNIYYKVLIQSYSCILGLFFFCLFLLIIYCEVQFFGTAFSLWSNYNNFCFCPINRDSICS